MSKDRPPHQPPADKPAEDASSPKRGPPPARVRTRSDAAAPAPPLQAFASEPSLAAVSRRRPRVSAVPPALHRPSDGPAKEYDIGYRKPPTAHQWRKGVSGNPRGRVKGSKNVQTIWRHRLNDRVKTRVNGKVITETSIEAIIRGVVYDTLAKRDLKNVAHVLREVERLGIFSDPDQGGHVPAPEALDVADEEIVRRFLDRLSERKEP